MIFIKKKIFEGAPSIIQDTWISLIFNTVISFYYECTNWETLKTENKRKLINSIEWFFFVDGSLDYVDRIQTVELQFCTISPRKKKKILRQQKDDKNETCYQL